MNLSEFIEETLSEILAGVRAVQSKEGGMAVGAETDLVINHGNMIFVNKNAYTIVDFDVSVAAETEAKGKAGIKVLSFGGIEGGGGHTHQEIAVQVPNGDPTKPTSFNRQL